MHFSVGDINYGGRVTDAWDQKCLQALVERFLNELMLTKSFRLQNAENYSCPGAIKEF